MRKLILLATMLCAAWGLQAQNLEQKIEGDTACSYTDNLEEKLFKEKNVKSFGYVQDSLVSRQMATEMGNRILPKRVKGLLKQELKKAPEQRGGFVIHYMFDRQGNICSANISVWGSLYKQITKEEAEMIYANLMKEKIDMGRGEIKLLGEDESAMQYARGTLWFVSDEPFMTFAGANVVDLK